MFLCKTRDITRFLYFKDYRDKIQISAFISVLVQDSFFLEINSILSFEGMDTASRTRNEHSANAFL